MRHVVRHCVPDNVPHLHVQQPFTYKKPEADSAVLGSWWWAVCRPKHVELHIKWTLSGTVCLTTSTIYTSNNLSRIKNQRMTVQFWAPDDGRVSAETCWASYKYGIIKFWYILASCWIFLYEFYKRHCKERFSCSHEWLAPCSANGSMFCQWLHVLLMAPCSANGSMFC